MKVLTVVLLLISLQYSGAVSPADCNDVEPVAEKALDLINKWRRNGYFFQLLRVADAHLDRAGSATVYYLALDVKESDCWVLSRNQEDCTSADFRRPSDIVIGQCKAIAIRYSNESQDLRMYDFNCTTSSVSSALGNSKDSPVILDFFEDTEQYRKQADKALDKYKSENGDFASFRVDRIERVARAKGGEKTKYYLDFSVRNCSTQHFPRPPKIFGFCRADLSYDAEASDLEAPEALDITCEVFNFEEHRNFSGTRPHWGPPPHFGGHGHFPPGHHPPPHKSHKFGSRPPAEGKDNSDRSPFQEGDFPPLPPPGSRCHPPHFGTNETHRHPHNRSSSDRPPHGPHSQEHGPHGHGPHGHGPHGHGPHGHGPRGPGPHGHGPHGHGPRGPGPHGHGPRGHGPHGHGPHGHDFDDYGPCDPPTLGQGPPDHHPHGHGHGHGHGPPHRHSGKRGPGKGHFPFHRKQIGSIVRLPPLTINEVLPLPEANFPNFSLPNCNDPLNPEIQSFPQSASESCPGKFKSEFLHLAKFFAYTSPK